MYTKRGSVGCFGLAGAYCLQCSWSYLFSSLFRTSRATWRTDRDMGLMNAIGLQPRNPPTSVTSQGTQTLMPQLQNAETQTEREVQEQESTSAGTREGRSSSNDLSDRRCLVSEEFPHRSDILSVYWTLSSLQQRFLQSNLPVARPRWSGEWISVHMNREFVFFTYFFRGQNELFFRSLWLCKSAVLVSLLTSLNSNCQ